MPKIAKYLSDRAVAAIKTEGRHPVGGTPGLLLRVTDTGHRGWVLRVTVGDKRKDMGLGSYPATSLSKARDKAREVHDSLRKGIVPPTPAKAVQKAIERQTVVKTFIECANDFMRDRSGEWKNAKHRQQWENSLANYAYPHMGKLSVNEINLTHVLACLEPIWASKTETASRLRGRVESVLDWATVREYRQGDNPARWKGHLDKVLPAPSKLAKVEHHRALPIDGMVSFMADLRHREGIAARALEFTILTAARSGEVRGATWAEIDSGVWTVPASRMKAGKEHRVPLSGAALTLLANMPRMEGTELVFPGSKGQPLSDMTMTAVLRRMEVDAVPHGFRSTFRDWCGDRTNYPRDLAEAALAHTLSDAVEAAYRRGDALEKRREMMEVWAGFISAT